MGLDRILESLPLTQDIQDALLVRNGPYGEALSCVIAYERGEFLHARFDRLPASQMTDAYLVSARWADRSADSMAG